MDLNTNKLKVLIASSNTELRSYKSNNVQLVHLIDFNAEDIPNVIEKNIPDVIIIDELLESNRNIKELILIIRMRYPELRIIYILEKENAQERTWLYSWMIFDVLVGKFTIDELENAVLHPKEFKDIKKELKNFPKDDREWYD